MRGMEPLVLASASPRRRELLERIGVPLEVEAAEVDERQRPGEDAVSYARRLAAAKAAAVAGRRPGRWVLGADTVVEVGGAILGKAGGVEEAREMIRSLAGRVHRVTTAFALRAPAGGGAERAVSTEVTMRALSDAEIDDYLGAGEWEGKAGAYAVQGIAAALVSELRGSVTNVIGLPLAEVIEELGRAGGPRPAYAEGRPA